MMLQVELNENKKKRLKVSEINVYILTYIHEIGKKYKK